MGCRNRCNKLNKNTWAEAETKGVKLQFLDILLFKYNLHLLGPKIHGLPDRLELRRKTASRSLHDQIGT